MTEFGISAAQIVGLWMETLFLGVYLVTCGFALHAFLWHVDGKLKKLSEINWILFITAICLCFIAVFDVALGLLHNFQAFIFYTGPGGSDSEFTNISDWVNVMKSVTVLIQTMLGDGMLIYRCWIIHSRSLRILILPVIFFLGDLSCAIVVIYRESTLRAKVLVNYGDIKPLFSGFYVASILLNILTTTLIIIRIWRVERERSKYAYQAGTTSTSARPSSRRRKSRLAQVIRIIIESGLIITLTSIVSIIAYVSGSNSIYATSDVLVQNIGIAFNLIIIRARSQSSDEYTLYSENTTTAPQLLFPNDGRDTTCRQVTEDLPPRMSLDERSREGVKADSMKRIQIKVERELHDAHILTVDLGGGRIDNGFVVRTV